METMTTIPESVYVVFGSTGGIGSALCRRLVARGARVLAVARDHGRLSKLASELGCETASVDAIRFEEVGACLESAAAKFGHITGVANCVGSLLLKSAQSTSEDEWHQTVSTNLTSAFAVVRAATKVMAASGSGSIVLVSSAAARLGLANHEAIAAAKAGVIGLTLSAAATNAPRGIRVNCVAPGLVTTPMTSRLTQNEMSRKASVAMHALGRIGEPEDVASAIDWLLSTDQSWVTGQVLGIDGGLGSLRSR